jgi:hypothetical protein
MLSLLDCKGGNIGWLYNALATSSSAGVDMSKFFTHTNKGLKSLFRDQSLTIDKILFMPLDGEHLGKETTVSDFCPIVPRWCGNPGVSFTELLVSYLSCYDPFMTAGIIHLGTGSFSRATDAIGSVKTSLEASRQMMNSLYFNNRSVYMEDYQEKADRIQDSVIASIKSRLSETDTPAYTALLAIALTTGDPSELRQFLRNQIKSNTEDGKALTEVALSYSTEQTLMQILNNEKSNYEHIVKQAALHGTSEYFEKQLTQKQGPGAPVPRPWSDQQVIALRAKIVNNVAEELSYYARVPTVATDTATS